MAKKTAQAQMSPEAYRARLAGVKLVSITLESFTLKTDRSRLGEGMKLSVKHKVGYEPLDNGSVTLSIAYDLTATRSNKREAAITLSAAFSVVLDSDEPLMEAFLDIFTKVNLPVNTWPYFRELAQNMLQRAGLPPITLPFWRS